MVSGICRRQREVLVACSKFAHDWASRDEVAGEFVVAGGDTSAIRTIGTEVTQK